MKKEEIEKLKQKITDAYRDRDDYPPFELNFWNDRNRFQKFIFKILDEEIED